MERKDFENLCEKMDFNPFAVFGDKPIFEHYPRLSKIKFFSYIPDSYEKSGWTKKNLSKLLSFVILFIDTQSPLFEVRDYELRKADAMRFLRLEDLEKAEIREEGELFQELIHEYFKLINEHNYEQWFTYKSQIHSFNAYLRKPLGLSDPTKIPTEVNARKALMQQLDGFNEKLQHLEALIFQDERIIKLINEKTVQNSVGGYAERFAENPSWH